MTDPDEPEPLPDETETAEAADTAPAEDAPETTASSASTPDQKRPLIIVLAVIIIAASIGLWFGVFRTKPTDVVKGYLAALARADAASALAYGCEPASSPFLNDAVLAKSQQLAPLTVDSILTGSSNSDGRGQTTLLIRAKVAFGDRPASLDFVLDKKSGQWCINGTTEQVYLNSSDCWLVSNSDTFKPVLPAFLNGIPVTGAESIDLFPGRYELTTSNKLVALSQNLFTVDSIGTKSNITIHPALTLTEEAQRTFTSMAETALHNCLAEKTTQTSCGFGTLSQGDLTDFYIYVQYIDMASLRWSIEGEAPDLTGWRISRHEGFIDSTSTFRLALRLTASRLDGQADVWQIFHVVPAIDITDPDNPLVVWQGV